jgi:outer membrane protein TolC
MRILKITTIAVGLMMLLFAGASARQMDYRELKQEYQREDPPLFYKQSIAVSAAKSVAGEEGIAEAEFRVKQEELEELKQRWDAIIKRISRDDRFFDFEAEESKRIRRLANTEEIKEILKRGIDLDSLISIAFERNPGLMSARKEWLAVLEKYSQATRLDNILRQYQSFIKDLNTKVGPMRHKTSVSQKFPFPGTLTLKGDIVTKEVEIARESYLITLRDLITDIKNTYYELLYSGHAIQITDENLKLLKHLETVAYVKYKTGQAGYSDVVKVQTRISKLEDDLITWREYKDTVIAKLDSLLNLPPQFPLGPPAEVKLRDTALSLRQLIDLGLESQQELKITQLKIDKTRLAIELAEKKFYPDFTLGFSYFEDEQGNLVGVGRQREAFSLKPVAKTRFWFGKNDAYIRQAQLVYQSLIKELESQRDKFRFGVKQLFFQLDTAKRDVLLYKDSLLLLAKNNLDVAQIDYQSGKADFLDVLDAQRIWLDYNLLYQKYIREQNQGLARLERIVGRVLPE